ncbi:hypothetical protein N0V90_011400 [Kalmusia sp. IMI 367209]|nr:hypothetical protein N0V90_011400 [Kalmusia sp. IMI 367209]
MVQYQLEITIDQKWVDYFNKNPNSNWKFCFARKSQSVGSDTTFNVVAYSDTITNKITVQWEDKYSMAGGKKGFSAGATISVATSNKTINYGEGFYLLNWATTSIKKGGSAPKNGFLFHNVPEAAAILYQEIQGVATPVYITPEDILPPNTTEILVPKLEVAVWFQRQVTTGTMVDSALTDAFTIPMETANVSGSYNAAGAWSITQAPVFYGAAADIAALESSSTEPTIDGGADGLAATVGRIFVGTISFGENYVTEAQRTSIVNAIKTGLPKYVVTPRFEYIDRQNQLNALLIKFSAHDTPNTPLQHALGAWNSAFDSVDAELRRLSENKGAVVDEQYESAKDGSL